MQKQSEKIVRKFVHEVNRVDSIKSLWSEGFLEQANF